MEITLYSKQGCVDCRKAKMFFNNYEISFTEKDILVDPEAMKEMEKMGSKKLATIVIGDKVFPGFSENMYEIKELLNIE